MNRDTQVAERPEVELDERWRGTAIVAAIAAVVLPILYIAAEAGTDIALWVSPVLGTDPGVDVATSEVAKLDPGVADYGLGSIITEPWQWVLYPPLYLATAVLLLISLRRESPVAPVGGIGGGS